MKNTKKYNSIHQWLKFRKGFKTLNIIEHINEPETLSQC